MLKRHFCSTVVTKGGVALSLKPMHTHMYIVDSVSSH